MTGMVVTVVLAFAFAIYLLKPFGSPTRVPAEATLAADPPEQRDAAIPVDGIRYVTHVDAQAQTDTDRILLLAHCTNRSVQRATISRETAILIRDRLSRAIDLA